MSITDVFAGEPLWMQALMWVGCFALAYVALVAFFVISMLAFRTATEFIEHLGWR